MQWLSAIVAVVCVFSLLVVWQRYATLRREAFIRSADLPAGLFDKLRQRHPHLTLKDCQLVARGLRQFFLAHLKSGRRFVSMPSQVTDDLWHEFILYTRHYDVYCRQAFGQFLHHTPAVVLTGDRQRNEGLRRCWWFACKEEHINPRMPTRLPLLFALDTKLSIAGGFQYVPDCDGVRRQGDPSTGTSPYCGGDFSSSSFDGGTSGFSDSGGADGGSDGCGGGGCGGGGD